MKNTIRNSLLQYLIEHRNAYLGLALISLFINIVLSFAIFGMIGHERVILVPPTINKSFWVESNSVSSEYLAEISEFFINLRFNISPSSIKQQRDTLLRYVEPTIYETLKSQLITEEERVNKEHINMAFFPVDIKVDQKNLQVMVNGDLQTTIGNNNLPLQRVAYKITYRYNSGRLWVTSLEEVKNKR